MKIIKRLLIVLCLIAIALFTAGLVFLKNFDLDRYRPQVIRQLKTVTGRDVQLASLNMDVSFSSGVEVQVKGLVIPARSRDAAPPLLTVAEADLSLDVLAFIQRREIRVTRLECVQPRVHVVLDKQQGWNFQDILLSIQQKDSSSATPAAGSPLSGRPVPTVAGAKPGTSLPKLSVQAIRLADADVSFIFRDNGREYPFRLSRLSLDIFNFSLDQPFSFSSEASLWSPQKNVMLRGRSRLDPAQQQIRLDDVVFQLSLDDLAWDQAPAVYIELAHFSKDKPLAGQLKFILSQGVFGREDVMLSGEGELNGGRLALADLPRPLEQVQIKFHVRDTDLTLEGLQGGYGRGTITASGSLQDLLTKQAYALQAKVEQVDVPDLWDSGALKVEGLLGLSVNLKGEGFDPDRLKDSLSAGGSGQILDGRIESFNMLKTVLEKIAPIPGLADMALASLPEDYRRYWERDTTAFETAELTFKLFQGVLTFDHLEVDADDFSLSAAGQVDAAQNLGLTAAFFIQKDLSVSLLEDVPELQSLQTRDGLIEIPLKSYQGPLQSYRPFPDLGPIGKKVLADQGKHELNKLLNKVLDIGEESTPQEEPSSGDPNAKPADQQKKEPAIGDQIIDGLFDKIFK